MASDLSCSRWVIIFYPELFYDAESDATAKAEVVFFSGVDFLFDALFLSNLVLVEKNARITTHAGFDAWTSQ